MEYTIYVVDAFTEASYKGNAAAVVIVDTWPDVPLMQHIATQNNLSETAYIKPISLNRFHIRWFSPLTEIDFCGHATLAASHVLLTQRDVNGTIAFETEKVGTLSVQLSDQDRIEMSFPNQLPTEVSNAPKDLIDGLSKLPCQVLRNEQAYFAVFDDAQDVIDIEIDSALLKRLAPYDVVVTAPYSAHRVYDVISRYFWPANGGDEDPVTGSIHAGLAPYWATKLQKHTLTAYQASQRGGVLHCVVGDKRILISGRAKLYLKGSIFV